MTRDAAWSLPGGLRSRHEIVVTEVGHAVAPNVVITELRGSDEQVIGTSLGPACTVPSATQMRCNVGSLAPRASFTLVVDSKHSPGPSGSNHQVSIAATVASIDASHMGGYAQAVGRWRFWMCGVCASVGFSDGYPLACCGIAQADESVLFGDGSVVRPDGVLVRADGKLVLTDGTTSPPSRLRTPPRACRRSAVTGRCSSASPRRRRTETRSPATR